MGLAINSANSAEARRLGWFLALIYKEKTTNSELLVVF